jgi:D-inositol-3-phosphate glycosyltransferase
MNVYIDELARALAREGIQVDVFTRRHSREVPATVTVEKGFVLHHVDAGPAREMDPQRTVRYLGAFADQVIDQIRFLPELRLVHSHYWLSGWAGLRVKSATALPHVHSFHSLGRVKDRNRRPDAAPEALTRLAAEQDVIDGSDRIITSTDTEKADLVDHYSVDPSNICVAAPGVDHDLFTPGLRKAARIRLGWPDVPTVLFVGRIQPAKGPDVALEAFRLIAGQVEDSRLVIVGAPSGSDGRNEYEMLQKRAKSLNLSDRVTFAEPIPHREMPDVYRASDITLVPSRSESFGLVAAEAQASGVPVLAARVGGLTDVVGEDSGGVLVDGWGSPEWSENAIAILKDPSLAAELSRLGPIWAERYSWHTSVARIADIYREML